MLKIVYISSEYPPETGYGGIGTYTKYIAEGMAERGHLVFVISSSADSLEKTYKSNGVNIYRIPYVSYPLPSSKYAYPLRRFFVKYFPHFLNRLCWSIAVKNKLLELVKSYGRFDIIESPECGGEGLFVSKDMCKRFVVRLHTSWEIVRNLDRIKEPIGDLITVPLIENLSVVKADAISTPSNAIVNKYSKRFKLKKVSIIPNPLNLKMIKKSIGEFWIFIGRVERIKGVHTLIEAYSNILKRFSPPDLLLIGRAYGKDPTGIDYGDFIKNKIKSLNIEKKIKWIEGVDLEQVYEYLSLSKVAFFPSIWENYPYSCLEAMASECMVVASMCGGLQEIIIPNETGFLVTPDSPKAIEAAMEYILKNPEEVMKFGKKARRWVEENVNTILITENMEKFYYKILGENR
ncbi:MAG: glycosyltransferase family 4 protein [Chitinispirillaceae bacterium]|nr:glycosyltransferase family 4 protein [Chitinispirillaceae bacterium]